MGVAGVGRLILEGLGGDRRDGGVGREFGHLDDQEEVLRQEGTGRVEPIEFL